MIIAVNTRILSGSSENSQVIQECFTKLVVMHPSHQFIFISEKEIPWTIPALPNIKTIVILQESDKPLLWKWWYNYKFSAALRKYNTDIIIHADVACSLRTRVPQFVLVNDLSVFQKASWLPRKYTSYIKTNIPLFFKKAVKVIATSQTIKSAIIERYKIDEQKIMVLHSCANQNYQPVGWNEKEGILEKYTGGKEYFLFSGKVNEAGNLVTLLKAFSYFKKRQKSNMQLLITTENLSPKNAFINSLRLYKYRNDVKLLQDLPEEELMKITASAYAFVYPVLHQSGAEKILNAMQCKVQCIVSNFTVNNELFGDSVLFVSPENNEAIATGMMLLFKDENRREELIKKGHEQVRKYSWDETTLNLWQTITATNTIQAKV